MTTPRVSVLLPVCNGLPWLEESLRSLSAQTLGDIEILVLEDGSTDATAELLASWPDPRVRTIPTGGRGIAGALAIGLREAKAPLIARQDADDVSLPERLEKQATYLERYTHIDLVACLAEYIDAKGEQVAGVWVDAIRAQHDTAVTPDQIRDLMPLTCCITHGSIVARADVLRAAGGYRDGTAPAEDYDLWLRLLPQAQLAKLPERLYQYRVHEAQSGARARDSQLRQTIAAKLAYLRRLCPKLPSPTRLAVVGSGAGADVFCEMAPEQRFVPVPGLPALMRERLPQLARPRLRRRAFEGWDVMVITDLVALEAYRTMFCVDNGEGGLTRIGNFFVKSEYVGAEDVASAFRRKEFDGERKEYAA
jgi:hypothetical protein